MPKHSKVKVKSRAVDKALTTPKRIQACCTNGTRSSPVVPHFILILTLNGSDVAVTDWLASIIIYLEYSGINAWIDNCYQTKLSITTT